MGWCRAGSLAAAVWLGTNDGKPLRTKDGSYDEFGATGPAPIWPQFMERATAATTHLTQLLAPYPAARPLISDPIGARQPLLIRPRAQSTTSPPKGDSVQHGGDGYAEFRSQNEDRACV